MVKGLSGRGLALVILLAAGLCFIQTPAYSQEQMARVASFVGEVFVRSQVTAPAGEWRRLTAAPANLFNGDEVRTERGRAEIIYPNDDAVRLLENSTARFTLSQEPRRRFLFFRRMVNLRAVATTAGKMWANVKVDRDNEMEFRSPVAVASVRGTVLEYQYDPGTGRAFVGVASGLVRLVAQGVGVNVGANRAATVAQGQPPSMPFPYTPSPPPAISETAMAAALAAPPAPPPPAPPVAVAPPAPAPVAVAAAPAVSSGGGGAITTAPAPVAAPAPAPTAPSTVPAYTGFVSGIFPSGCNDCAWFLPFTGGFTFPFYGTTYTSAFVNENGHITFNDAAIDWMMSINQLFRATLPSSTTPRPTIATLHDDPDPRGGTVNVTQFANSFVVTYRNVPNYPSSNPGSALNTFRTSLFSNGQIMMEFNNTTLSGKGAPQTGISSGGLDARLNVVDFSSIPSTGLTGLSGAIFQTFYNPVFTGIPRSISHATIAVPGFPNTTIFLNDIRTGSPSTFTGNTYVGTSPVSGAPFSLFVSLGGFSLSYPSTFQTGLSSFSTATNVLSILSAAGTTPAGEFQFMAGQNIPVTIYDRPLLDLLNATLIFTPNAVGGYDVSFLPTAPVIAASPST